MKRPLQESAETPAAKKQRTRTQGALQEFYGFADQESVHLKTLKLQNLELFCKKLQQQNQSEREKKMLVEAQEGTKKYNQRSGLIEDLGQKLLQKVNFDCFAVSFEDLGVQSTFVQRMATLLGNLPGGNNKFSKHMADLEGKLLTFFQTYDKERTRWESIRAMLRPLAGAELAAQNVKLCQDLDRFIGGQYDVMVHLLTAELTMLGMRDSQASLRSIRTEIRVLKQLIEHEARQQRLLESQANIGKSVGDLDSVCTTEQHLEIQNDMDVWDNILRNRRLIVEEIKQEKILLQNEYKELLEYENGHAPSVDGIRSSTEYRSLEKSSYCAEPETILYRRETETMVQLIQEGRDHIRNDNDQRLRLEQAATKTIEEKLELVESKTKQTMKENSAFETKLQERRADTPNLNTLRTYAQKMIDFEEQIQIQRQACETARVELQELKEKLDIAEQQPGNFTLVDQITTKTRECHRAQQLIIAKEKELEEGLKQEQALQAQERNLSVLINLYKNKVSKEKGDMIAVVSAEKAVRAECLQLTTKIQQLQQQKEQSKADAGDSNKAPEPAPANDDQTLSSIRLKNKEIQAEIEALEKQEKAMRESIAKQQKETEDVNAEISMIENEFLVIQSQNSLQAKHIIESEETNLRLVGEKVRNVQINALAQRKSEILNEKLAKTEGKVSVQEDVIKKQNKQLGVLEEQNAKTNAEIQSLRNASDPQGTMTRDCSNVNTDLKGLYEQTQLEMEKLRGSSGAAITILEEEKAQAWKHSEELELLRKQLNLWIERGRQGDAGETSRQLDHYKKIVNCGNCRTRPKNCVITRCFHVFCRECVSGTGRRACPKCDAQYSDRDLQAIYL